MRHMFVNFWASRAALLLRVFWGRTSPRIHNNPKTALMQAVAVMGLLGVVYQQYASNSIDQQPTFLSKPSFVYRPAPIEKMLVDDAASLGFDVVQPIPEGCKIWNDESLPYHKPLRAFRVDLEKYNKALVAMEPIGTDLRELLKQQSLLFGDVCAKTRLHPAGLSGIFTSGQISLTSMGYAEPIVPPMRHPDYCVSKVAYLMNMSYLVHDFEFLCRKLKPTSKTVLLDLGASLDFHAGAEQPAFYLIALYQKFGIKFDHIYAFELGLKTPSKVYEAIPHEFMTSYHWVNVGIESDKTSKLNPWHGIVKQFSPDDLVIVKLDVDSPALEVQLAHQLLDDRELHDLVDVFYFEHHVFMLEIARNWGPTMDGSIKDTLDLFTRLRKSGIASHFWP